MPVPNIAKVVLHYSGYGEEGAITWWYDGLGSKTEDELNTLAANIDTALADDTIDPLPWTALQSFLTLQQSWDSISIYQYAVSNGPATGVAHHAVSGRPGTQNSLYGGLQVAAVLTLHTGAAGRRNRGRQYWPGFARQATEATALYSNFDTDAMAQNALLAQGQVELALRQDPGNDGTRWCVYSRVGDSARHITSASMDNRPDTQRRRAESLSANYTYTAPVSPS